MSVVIRMNGVLRKLPDGSSLHMATCLAGMAHDRLATGHDHTTAVNPTGY